MLRVLSVGVAAEIPGDRTTVVRVSSPQEAVENALRIEADFLLVPPDRALELREALRAHELTARVVVVGSGPIPDGLGSSPHVPCRELPALFARELRNRDLAKALTDRPIDAIDLAEASAELAVVEPIQPPRHAERRFRELMARAPHGKGPVRRIGVRPESPSSLPGWMLVAAGLLIAAGAALWLWIDSSSSSSTRVQVASVPREVSVAYRQFVAEAQQNLPRLEEPPPRVEEVVREIGITNRAGQTLAGEALGATVLEWLERELSKVVDETTATAFIELGLDWLAPSTSSGSQRPRLQPNERRVLVSMIASAAELFPALTAEQASRLLELSEGDDAMLVEAIWAVWSLPGDGQVNRDLIAPYLTRETKSVRVAAIDSLSSNRLSDPSLRQRLAEALSAHPEDVDIVGQVIGQLRKWGDHSLDSLLYPMLDFESSEIRRHVAGHLLEGGDETMKPLLEDMVHSSELAPIYRYLAAGELVRVGRMDLSLAQSLLNPQNTDALPVPLNVQFADILLINGPSGSDLEALGDASLLAFLHEDETAAPALNIYKRHGEENAEIRRKIEEHLREPNHLDRLQQLADEDSTIGPEELVRAREVIDIYRLE
ncbi:MAG: hypothetical protein RL885_24310 [Planctomycetota bacterium]